MKYKLLLLINITFLLSCNLLYDKPSNEKMKECLSNELLNKAIVEGFDQQDGLTREKDGVKYYEGYFNAEIKFIANTSSFSVGERYKIIKGTLSFMKTEKGWNCQQFDFSSSNFVKINDINAKADFTEKAKSFNNQSNFKKFYVSGNNLEDLREKLKLRSSAILKNKDFTPVNCLLNINNFSFTCDLEPKSSNFSKLSLLYGPSSTGCESCDNALMKNPGSIAVAKYTSSGMIYNVIAIIE
jgi:hypothetical protein